MPNHSHHNNINHHHSSTPPLQQYEQQRQQGLLCKLGNANVIKADRDHQDQMMDDGDEGFKTPTKKEQRITVDLRCPPPAPRKPMSQPMKRRRPSRRTLFQFSPKDVELLFSPRPLLVKEKDTLLHIDSSNDPAANISKVNSNSPDFTSPLMPLR